MSVVIASGFTGTAVGLAYPRVGWRRLTGTIAASTSAAGYAAANAATSRTDTFWKATTLPATWAVDFGSAQNVSYCGIASHTIGSSGATVIFELWNGSAWITIATTTPVDNGPILFLCAVLSRSQARIRITGSTVPVVGVVFFGAVTEWPQLAVYAPSVSFQRASQTDYAINITDGGQWAGRTIIRKSTNPKMQVDNLSESWMTSQLDDFAAYAEREPFFIADRPGTYPDSVAYAWTSSDIIPERATPNASVSGSIVLDLIGHRAT
jgi:hypothetical protein